MRKLVTTAAVAALALGLGVAAPTQANAFFIAPAWFALAIAGSVAGGAVVGAEASHANDVAANAPPPGPAPSVTVTDQPTGPGCYFTHARIHGVLHRVQVCN